MSRIAGVSAREAGPFAKLGFRMARRQLGRLTGRDPELKAATLTHCEY